MAHSNKGSTDNYFVPRSNDSMHFLTGTFDDQGVFDIRKTNTLM